MILILLNIHSIRLESSSASSIKLRRQMSISDFVDVVVAAVVVVVDVVVGTISPKMYKCPPLIPVWKDNR